MDFKEIYGFPIELRYSKVMSKKYFRMVFDFVPLFLDKDSLQLSLIDKEKIVRILNGSEEKILVPKKYKYLEGYIYINDKKCILIRGWGYLTGIGGLNLSGEKASEIQNQLANYIIETLQNAEIK